MGAASQQTACLTIAVASLAAAGSALAQTPAQIEYERAQREAWRAQEQQRQEQQRQQQIQNENARRQQQESSDAARRSQEQSHQSNQEFGQNGRQQQASPQSQAQGAQLEAARQAWLKQPALAAERNPLLGRWTRPASSRSNSSDPFAALGALAKGGLCELMFGGGVFEFRPGTLVGKDRNTPEQELDRVEYRGDARQVVVIPKTTFKLMVFDFDGPDRISWQGQNCAMVRVKVADNVAAAAPTAPTAAKAVPVAVATAAGGGAVLSVVAGLGRGDTFRPLAGHKFIVLKQSADIALTRAGFRPAPGLSTINAWSIECQRRTPACRQGAEGLKVDSLGYLQTDAQGKAQGPLLPGAYYLFGSARQGDGEVFWNLRVDVKPGNNTVMLDQGNLRP